MKIFRVLLILGLILTALSCKKPTELLQLDDPTFSPSGGTVNAGQPVSISCTEYGATIHYTKDGTEPDSTSTVYTTPLIIDYTFMDGQTTRTIKAKAYKTGFDPSNVSSSTYTINYYQTVSTPIFSPLSGTIPILQDINILCGTIGASIYYTMDGTDPDQTSTHYTGAFAFPTAGTYTLKARAYKANWNASPIATTSFTVTVK